MEFYYGLSQTSASTRCSAFPPTSILLTGQISMAQAAFYAIGAYASGMLTVLCGLAHRAVAVRAARGSAR